MFRLLKQINIYAMSVSRKDLASEIETNTRIIFEHIAKLYYFQNDKDDINHWRGEVYSYFNQIKRLKGSNKFPSADFIFNNTYEVNTDSIQICMDDVYEDYSVNHVPTREYNIYDYTNIVKDYYEWLSTILSQRGRVSRNSVYAKLESLGL